MTLYSNETAQSYYIYMLPSNKKTRAHMQPQLWLT